MTDPTARTNADASVVSVASGQGAYPILVGAGVRHRLPELLAEHAPAHRYAVISDDRVAPLYGDPCTEACRSAGLRAELFTFPRGEASKTRKQWSILTDALLDAGIGRDGVVVAVGGGVTGDLAGFVAATFMRGLPVVHVPTSLVAMVDAAVGGKTGVNVRAGKNLVGAFHAPRIVAADTETIRTLPREERAQGLAEAVKHGAILDAEYFAWLAAEAGALMDGDTGSVQHAVLRSVQLKADVVGRDEREGGVRQILNFGHTLGHALESASGYRLGHGTAVAAGMVLEAGLGERLGITAGGTAASLEACLAAFGLGAVPALPGGSDAVLSHVGVDKKARGGRARFVFLRRVGVVAEGDGWGAEAPADVVRHVVEAALEARATLPDRAP